MIVPPRFLYSAILPKHLRWNCSSPTANTSSSSSTSASMCAATENPSRMNMPDEYVRTGRSMNRSSSANETISSIASRTRARDSPWIEPFRYTFSRPVNSGWNPAPSSSSEATRPPASTRPEVGPMIPETMRRSVVLPEPLRPTRPTASPGSTVSETSRSACTSRAPDRPRETKRSLSVRCAFG